MLYSYHVLTLKLHTYSYIQYFMIDAAVVVYYDCQFQLFSAYRESCKNLSICKNSHLTVLYNISLYHDTIT